MKKQWMKFKHRLYKMAMEKLATKAKSLHFWWTRSKLLIPQKILSRSPKSKTAAHSKKASWLGSKNKKTNTTETSKLSLKVMSSKWRSIKLSAISKNKLKKFQTRFRRHRLSFQKSRTKGKRGLSLTLIKWLLKFQEFMENWRKAPPTLKPKGMRV